MPLNRPTLPELIERAQTDVESRLPGADAKVRRTNLNVLARVFSGLANGLYGFLQIVYRQWFAHLADEENLRIHAAMWLKQPVIPAEYAAGAVTIPATTGKGILVGEKLQRSDGVMYEVSAEAVSVGGVATVAISAVEPGQAGNAVAGVKLQLVSPVDGFDSTATVTSGGITGGADEEGVDSIRERVLSRKRATPMGGAGCDYHTWAREVPGVTRAWVYPKELGRGTVTIRIMRDNDVDPFPGPADLANTFAYIDERCNVGMESIVVSPIDDPVHYQIRLMPDTPSIRAAVEAELRDLHLRVATPGGNYYDPKTRLMKAGGILLRTHMTEAISIAAGEQDHELLAPAGNIVASTGHLPTFGSITWVA